MEKGGVAKLLIGCGCLLGGLGLLLILFVIFYLSNDMELDEDILNQLSESSLTDEGKKYLETEKEELTEKFFSASSKMGIHWSYLVAISKLSVTKDDQDSCDDYWIGPMKIKELNWSGNQILNEFPDAKTNFSDCGDINDKIQQELKELKKLDRYRDQYNKSLESCAEKAREEKREMFCQAYGIDSNNDKKADPFDDKDAIMSVANLLAAYREIYGNLGQALNIAYGENEPFLRAVKNQVLTWLKDPSMDGILRWPLNPLESKVVTKRYKGTGNETGLSIQAKDGEKVFAVGSGLITEVGSDPSCGQYVKLTHEFYEDDQNISTIICNLTDISVKKGDNISIGDEIGKVKQQSLTIKMVKEKEEEQKNENEVDNKNSIKQSDKDFHINPEEYLTAPNDVVFPKEEE